MKKKPVSNAEKWSYVIAFIMVVCLIVLCICCSCASVDVVTPEVEFHSRTVLKDIRIDPKRSLFNYIIIGREYRQWLFRLSGGVVGEMNQNRTDVFIVKSPRYCPSSGNFCEQNPYVTLRYVPKKDFELIYNVDLDTTILSIEVGKAVSGLKPQRKGKKDENEM